MEQRKGADHSVTLKKEVHAYKVENEVYFYNWNIKEV
jgi:ribosomal protein L19